MNLADLQREAHSIAKDHGWWDEERSFGDLIALVHSELSEALEAYRERELEAYTPPDDVIGQPGKLGTTRQPHPFPGVGGYVNVKVSTKPEGVASELADVVIRVADMAEWHRIDLEDLVGQVRNNYSLSGSFGTNIAEAHYLLAIAWDEYQCGGRWPHHLGLVTAYIFRMAAHYGIDLDAAIAAKMEHNRTRSYRHGGKAL